MKKIILLSLLFVFSFLFSHAQSEKNQGINFRELTFDQAIAQSKVEHLPVFVHGFASWCHFCEFMKDSIYTDKEVGEFYNKNFISIKLDLEKEGKDLNKRLRASSFPQLVFYDSTGEVLHRVAGQKQKYSFLQVGKDALDPLKRFQTYEVKYKTGKLSDDEAPIYFRLLSGAAIEYQSTINNYLMRIPDSSFTSVNTWRIINEFLREVDMPAMTRFMQRRNDFALKYTADSVDNRILSNFNGSLMTLVQKLDTLTYNSMLQKLEVSKFDLAPKIIAYATLSKYKLKSEWEEYQKLAPSFVETYCKTDHRRMNEVVFTLYERGQGTAILEQCEGWSKKCVAMVDNFKYNSTYASILYKLGKKDEALKTINHALELGTKVGADLKQASLLREKIQEMPSK